MDSTYRDKFRQEIHKEIFTKCIDIFCKKFINKDRPVIVADEIIFQKVITNNEIHLKGHIYRIAQYGYTWEFIYTHNPSYSFCGINMNDMNSTIF
jgi:hypothetical protein